MALSREQTVEWEHHSPRYSLQVHVTTTARSCSCGLGTARNKVESQAPRGMKFSRASVLETHTKAPGKLCGSSGDTHQAPTPGGPPPTEAAGNSDQVTAAQERASGLSRVTEKGSGCCKSRKLSFLSRQTARPRLGTLGPATSLGLSVMTSLQQSGHRAPWNTCQLTLGPVNSRPAPRAHCHKLNC